MRSTWLVLGMCACGRIGFDAHDAGGGSLDGAADARADAMRDATPAFTPVTFLTTANSTTSTALQTSLTVDVNAGDLLVASTAWLVFQPQPTVTDSAGSTWEGGALVTTQGGPCGTGANGTSLALWIAEATTTGSDTVTVTQTVMADDILFVSRYAWGGGPFVLDASAQTVAPSASNLMSTTLTTTRDSFIVGFFQDLTGGSGAGATGLPTPGSGWANRVSDTFADAIQEDDAPEVPPGTYAVTANLPGAESDDCWGAEAYTIARP